MPLDVGMRRGTSGFESRADSTCAKIKTLAPATITTYLPKMQQYLVRHPKNDITFDFAIIKPLEHKSFVLDIFAKQILDSLINIKLCLECRIGYNAPPHKAMRTVTSLLDLGGRKIS